MFTSFRRGSFKGKNDFYASHHVVLVSKVVIERIPQALIPKSMWHSSTWRSGFLGANALPIWSN